VSANRRMYNQYCATARAPDIVGKRCTPLPVRELLTGPTVAAIHWPGLRAWARACRHATVQVISLAPLFEVVAVERRYRRAQCAPTVSYSEAFHLNCLPSDGVHGDPDTWAGVGTLGRPIRTAASWPRADSLGYPRGLPRWPECAAPSDDPADRCRSSGHRLPLVNREGSQDCRARPAGSRTNRPSERTDTGPSIWISMHAIRGQTTSGGKLRCN